MQSPFPRYLVPPRSKYSSQHHVLKHPQLPFFRNVSDQVSHPYKTTGKIIVLYIMIFKFLNSNLEDKRFCTEWQQAFPDLNLLLISSGIYTHIYAHAYIHTYTNTYIYTYIRKFLWLKPTTFQIRMTHFTAWIKLSGSYGSWSITQVRWPWALSVRRLSTVGDHHVMLASQNKRLATGSKHLTQIFWSQLTSTSA